MKKYLAWAILFFIQLEMSAQKVASYLYGKYGTKEYEHFSFWIKDDKRADIEYSYGQNPKELKLQFAGLDRLHEKTCFKVRFSNNYVLYITPDKFHLNVEDDTGKYKKSFKWEYEGPINGIGTFCDACASDEEEAMKFILSFLCACNQILYITELNL